MENILTTIPEMENEQPLEETYSLPKRYRRKGRLGRGCGIRQNETPKLTGEELLDHTWGFGWAYSEGEDWKIQPQHSITNLIGLTRLVNDLEGHGSSDFSLYCSREKTGREKAQLYIFKEINGQQLIPDYKVVCQSLGIKEFYELSFYFLVDCCKATIVANATDNGIVSEYDKRRVTKFINYAICGKITNPDDILGVMLKPNEVPQISLWIRNESSALAIKKQLQKELGFVDQLTAKTFGTRLQTLPPKPKPVQQTRRNGGSPNYRR